MLLQPSPASASVNGADIRWRDPKSEANFSLRNLAFESKDRAHLSFRELSTSHAVASRAGSVAKFIGLVFKARLPIQVALGHAAIAALAAFMRGIMLRSGRRPMLFLAGKARNYATVQYPIALPGSRIGPNQTFVAVVGEHNIPEIVRSPAWAGSPTKRVTVPPPAAVMRTAPAVRKVRLAAAWNRAYSIGSHRGAPVLPWSERAAVVTHPARSSFLPFKPLFGNGERQ